jgi:hypothetical protein
MSTVTLTNSLKLTVHLIFKGFVAQIQYCPISTTFHMWVDYDVPNRFLTLKNFQRSPFSKWPPQYRTNSTLSDFNDIVAAILKMAIVRIFLMSGINLGHHYPGA